ncbi:alkaline phosphatase family protein [Candidatus Woesearchaeota archaeon]|nr:alkaline phosphatase family protein [Candidatus Woesearchaeota archaeon]
MRKIVIGLDGLDPNFVRKWLDDLPNLKRLITEGTFKPMKSTIPPITVPAWMSMFSGKDPGELNAFDFQFFDKETKRFRVFSSKYWIKHMIWSNSPNKWCVLDVPGTYPPYEINGYMKSGFMSLNSKATYPKELIDEFEAENKPLSVEEVYRYATGSKKRKALVHNLNESIRFAKWIFNAKEWDRLALVLRITDETMHVSSREKDLKNAYVLADAAISEFVEDALNGKYELFITSDHGCKRVTHKFYLNTWLEKNNYLCMKSKPAFLKKTIIRTSDFLMNLGFKPVLELANTAFAKMFRKSCFQPGMPITECNIDWEKTRCLAQATGASSYTGIWLPSPPNEEFIQKLKSELEQIQEVEEVKMKSEVYKESGDRIPDMIIRLQSKFAALTALAPTLISRRESYIHDQYGVFISSTKGLFPDKGEINITQFAELIK